MRVLVVDAFCSASSGREHFSEFRGAIQKSFESSYYRSLTDLAFAVRDKSKLHDFLYDGETEFTDPAALRSFRALDMVFIGSDDTNVLPWSRSVRQVHILLKQCIRMHKPTFATSFAMQILVSACILEGENVKIFNGRGRGSAMYGPHGDNHPSLLHIVDQLKSDMVSVDVAPDEYFLDAGSGDLYKQQKRNNEGEWSVYKNVGIYNPVFAPKKIASQNVHGAYKSRTQSWSEIKPTRADELHAELGNARYLHHWILKGVSTPFVVPTRCPWRVTQSLPPYFDVLLAGKSPILVMLGPMCGLQGIITRKYPETVVLLDNWINHVARTLLNDNPSALGLCPDVLRPCSINSAFTRKNRSPSASDKGKCSDTVADVESDTNDARECDMDVERGMDTERGLRERWDNITRAFSADDVEKPVFRQLRGREIRRFLHPNLSDIEPAKVTKVVYVGSRPASRKQKNMEPLEPFRFAGKASTSGGFPNPVKNSVAITPGAFLCDHVFRSTDKKKWFNPRGFVPAAAGGWDEFPIAQDAAAHHTTNHIPCRSRDLTNARTGTRRPFTSPEIPSIHLKSGGHGEANTACTSLPFSSPCV
eukprot:GEMP01028612.1.p1 GENE.GEMP01028612.1~~GEMP01028612.1.p1  ORF type:complete len:590 (+),score=151.78 GEMP01028612.1:157-1926(+)